MIVSASMLADLGLERSANAERGLVVLAIIACALGLVSTWRWRFRPPSYEPTAGEDVRGWPFMRRTLIGVTQGMAGVLLVVLAARFTLPSQQRPDGWSLISPPAEVSALAIQGDTVWAGGKEGLFAVDRKTGVLIATPLLARDLRGVRALLVEGDSLWIGCMAGVFRWDGRVLEKCLPPKQADTGPIMALRRARDGALWIGASLGAWRVVNDEWIWVGKEDGLHLPTVDTIFEDRTGAIWLASKEPEAPGLWRGDGGKWVLFDAAQGLGHPAINDMIEDAQGVLWIACGFGAAGMAQSFADGNWVSADVRGLEGKKIRSLFEDSARRLWFCSEYDGVAIREGGAWRRLTMRDGLQGNEIKIMLEDADGNLWLGNERGLGLITGFK